MKIINLKYGLIIPEKHDPTGYVLGGGMLEKTILQPDGQWDNFLPKNEKQFDPNFDTSNCSAFGTTNCLEILFKRLYNE